MSEGGGADDAMMAGYDLVEDAMMMTGYDLVEDCVVVHPTGPLPESVAEREDGAAVLRAGDTWKRLRPPGFRHRHRSLCQVREIRRSELTNTTAG